MREPYISFTVSGLIVVWMIWISTTNDLESIVDESKTQDIVQVEPYANVPHMRTRNKWPIVFQKVKTPPLMTPDFRDMVFPGREFVLGGSVTPSLGSSIAMGDINGDNTPDFAALLFDDSVTGKYQEKINVLLSDSERQGEFSAPKTVVSLEGQHHGLVLADVNGDSYSDILLLGSGRNSKKSQGYFSILFADSQNVGTFKPPQKFYIDGFPVQIEIAEMNGDGKPDIVVSLMTHPLDEKTDFLMGFEGKIGILFSDSIQENGFSSLKEVFKSKYINTFTLGDFNGDQIADIVAITTVAGSNQNNSSGLINIVYSNNNKSGKLLPKVEYFSKYLSPLITKIKSHDINGDGYIDLVVLGGIHVIGGHAAFPISYSIDIFLAKPKKQGGFLPPIRLGAGVKFGDNTDLGLSKIAFFDFDIADLNHDGYAEIVTSSISGEYAGGVIQVYSGNPLRPDKRQSPFQFSGETSSSMTTSGYVFIGEFTGDDKLDIAIRRGGSGDDKINILTGSSASVINFDTSEHLILDDPRDIEVVDLNNDGHKDIVVANAMGGVDLLFADPARKGGFFIKETLPMPALSVYTHDLNKDGSVDIITVDSKAKAKDTITVSLGDSYRLGSFLPAKRYAIRGLSYSTHLRIADLNEDGLPDILPLNSYGGKIMVLWGDKEHPGEFLPAQDLLGDVIGNDVQIEDLNGDEKLDLIVSHCNKVSIYLSYDSEHGLFSKAQEIDMHKKCSSSVHVGIKDMNGDDKLDLIIQSDQVFIALADPLISGYFMPPKALNLGEKHKQKSTYLVEDLNADGSPDVVIEDQALLSVFVSDLKAKQGYVKHYSFKLDNGMSFSGFKDINGDGQLDMLLAGFDSVGFALADLESQGKFLKPQAYSVGTPPLMGFYFHDLNHDGKSDLIMIYNDFAYTKGGVGGLKILYAQ